MGNFQITAKEGARIYQNGIMLETGTYDFNMDVDENFSLLTEDTLRQNPEYVESLGHTATSVKKYFADNNLILYAASEDNSMQIQVKCTETEFSKQLDELSLLTDDDAADIAKRLLPDGESQNYNLLEIGDMLFFEVMGTEKDSGGEFCSLQYITIRGGRLYSIGYNVEISVVNKSAIEVAKLIGNVCVRGVFLLCHICKPRPRASVGVEVFGLGMIYGKRVIKHCKVHRKLVIRGVAYNLGVVHVT